MWPTSEQWGMPRIDPLYPVDRMVFSRTTTAPTNLRGHVDRDATTLAMFMKYSSQEARSAMVISTKKPAETGGDLRAGAVNGHFRAKELTVKRFFDGLDRIVGTILAMDSFRQATLGRIFGSRVKPTRKDRHE
jgi:hypothetical protein